MKELINELQKQIKHQFEQKKKGKDKVYKQGDDGT
jgi:hypothetical protein